MSETTTEKKYVCALCKEGLHGHCQKFIYEREYCTCECNQVPQERAEYD